ncbi:LbetaH domain-containing protein [Blastococcus deserti]|uniref:Carbonic anhydrase/acetyltransferase-like protein (Isoleucine patch superfamily) n=1 Tax=Blastococcus deserti TaxID=2259033 RepID=A0ABW4XDA6_9ACTN
MRRLLLTGATASVLVAGTLAPSALARGGGDGCHPTPANQPVCPRVAAADSASFLDPTARVSGGEHVSLGEQVYVGPFAELLAAEEAPITIGPSSNAQDNVTLDARGGTGIEVGDRVILAHGSSVLGTAEVGVHASPLPPAVVDAGVQTYDGSVFMSFGSQVEDATIEVNSGVSALARVAPGVTLHSGYLVLPGKNVTTQAEADDPALGKVRYLNQGDVEFNEGVIHVNEALAREYTELYREDPTAVRGVNVDPGHTDFNRDRDLPSFAGREQARPQFRNRIIGEVYLSDPFARFADRVGDRVAIRADEGEPFVIGHVDRMGDDVIFHALEHTDIHVGDDVRYGDGAIVHGGGRVVLQGQPEEQTVVGDHVRLGAESVVFRSTIGDGATIGDRSAVVGTELPTGAVVPPDTIVLNGQVFGSVEW